MPACLIVETVMEMRERCTQVQIVYCVKYNQNKRNHENKNYKHELLIRGKRQTDYK